MRVVLSSFIMAILTGPVFGQSLTSSLVCSGQDPAWSLTLDQGEGQFELTRTSELTLALETLAQGAQWPRALTLVGRGDSAIVILENSACSDGNLTARVLTQRGETPLLLTGCCTTSAN